MKTTVHARERLVGLFVIGAVGLATAAIAYSLSGTAAETRTYLLVLDQSYGLDKGKRVTMKGFEIGQISQIELRNDDTVLVRLLITSNFDRIRTDARAIITPPLDPVIPGGVQIEPGQAAEVMPNQAELPWVEPETDANKMRDDLAAFIAQLQEVAKKIQEDGLTTVLGEKVHQDIDTFTGSLAQGAQNLEDATAELQAIFDGLGDGSRSLQDVMFGYSDDGRPRTVMQGVFGDEVQRRIDAVANERAGLGEIFFGPLVWAEVENMSTSLSAMQTNLTQLLEDAQVLVRGVQLRMDDLEPIFRAVADEADGIGAAVRNIAGVTADLREVSRAIADEKEQIHIMATDIRQTIHYASKVTEALSRHWLLSAFVTPEAPEGFGVRPSRRPNHYGE